MFIRLVFTLTARIYRWLHAYAPSNRLVAAARAQPGLRWTLVSTAVSLTCWFITWVVANAIRDGAPGWVNLVVLLLAWDGAKTGLLTPACLIWTVRRRLTVRPAHHHLDDHSTASASGRLVSSAGRIGQEMAPRMEYGGQDS